MREGKRIATASVRTGLAMTNLERWRVGRAAKLEASRSMAAPAVWARVGGRSMSASTAFYHIRPFHLSLVTCPLRCSSHTSSTATSAGLTPEMREAWPMLTGRILASFSRASAFRAGMAL